jgi:Tat protein secretion system quality control protein TatD with DNase activity
VSHVGGMRLFDAHCHLQDARIAAVAPRLIRTAIDSGVVRFSVNGVSEVCLASSFILAVGQNYTGKISESISRRSALDLVVVFDS